jgi:dihydrofolate reductase
MSPRTGRSPSFTSCEPVLWSVYLDMKLTVQTFLTIDGVMQAPGGPQEDPSENFTYGGWQAPFPDPAVGEFVTELTSHASAFLFGRRTFDIFRGYWPDQTDPANPIATTINSLPSTSCPVPSARPAPPGAASTPTPPGW